LQQINIGSLYHIKPETSTPSVSLNHLSLLSLPRRGKVQIHLINMYLVISSWYMLFKLTD